MTRLSDRLGPLSGHWEGEAGFVCDLRVCVRDLRVCAHARVPERPWSIACWRCRC